MTTIDAKQAASALSEINSIPHRVRQSRIYDLASLMLVEWGILIFAGNLAEFTSNDFQGAPCSRL
jgi:hypothetical protein